MLSFIMFIIICLNVYWIQLEVGLKERMER